MKLFVDVDDSDSSQTHPRINPLTCIPCKAKANSKSLASQLSNGDFTKVISYISQHPKEVKQEMKKNVLLPNMHVPYTLNLLPIHLACMYCPEQKEDVGGFMKKLISIDQGESLGVFATVENDIPKPERRRISPTGHKGIVNIQNPKKWIGLRESIYNAWTGKEVDRRMGFLPIHLACIFRAHPSIIRLILVASPESAKYMDSTYDMLPIHLVCSGTTVPKIVVSSETTQTYDSESIIVDENHDRKGPEINAHNWVLSVVEMLLRAFPESMYVPGGTNKKMMMIPMDLTREADFGSSNNGNTAAAVQELLKKETHYWASRPLRNLPESDLSEISLCGELIDSSKTNYKQKQRSNIQGLHPSIVEWPKPTKLYKLVSTKKWEEILNLTSSEIATEASIWVAEEGLDCPRLPIHKACSLKPPITVIENLIMAYPEGAYCKEKYGVISLHVACQHFASQGVINSLLAAFPESVKVQDAFGLLPLHVACVEGASLGVVETLLKLYPESSKVKDNRGCTALTYTKASLNPNKIKIMEALHRDSAFWTALPGNSDKVTKLYNLVAARDWESVFSRLNEHPDEVDVWINDLDYGFPRLPIHMACGLNPPTFIVSRFLSLRKKHSEIKEKYGRLPLHIACQQNASADVVKVLIRATPNGVDARDNKGLLPLHIACLNGAPADVVRVLFETSKCLDTSNENSITRTKEIMPETFSQRVTSQKTLFWVSLIPLLISSFLLILSKGWV